MEKFEICFSLTGLHNSHSSSTNTELIGKIERISKLVHVILVKGSPASAIVPLLLITFVNYFILGMDDESFLFDQSFWFPFDANTPVGFFVAVLFEGISIFAECCFFTPIICVFIGSCWSIVTFLKYTARNISHLKKRKILHLNDEILIERFHNFVRFHAEVVELSGQSIFLQCHEMCDLNSNIHIFRLTGEFNDIHEFVIVSIFLYGLSTVASSLIVFQAVK